MGFPCAVDKEETYALLSFNINIFSWGKDEFFPSINVELINKAYLGGSLK